MVFFRIVIVLVTCLLASGCTFPFKVTRRDLTSPIQLVSHAPDEEKTIHIVGHGWHTGLIVRTNDVPHEVWPEVKNFEGAEYVELGWGDAGFYQAKKITFPLVLDAMFLPGPSVMHVVGFDGPVEEFFPVSDIIEIKLTDERFDYLCQFVSSTFERNRSGASKLLGPGLYGESFFFAARGKYYFPRTCNVWTASALKHAECSVVPQIATTADNVISQSRKFGRVIQRAPSGLKKAALSGEN